MKAAEFIKGKEYGRLTTLENLGVVKGNSVWKCQCSCGNIVSVKACNLKRGTKSCGCFNRDRSREQLKNPLTRPKRIYNVRTVKQLLYRYKAMATKCKRVFELTSEQFEHLIFQNCHYCDSPPRTEFRRADKEKSLVCRYNGIDRKDNNLHYTLDNCVSCCKRCNMAKHTMSRNEFLDMVFAIFRNLGP